MLGIFPWNVERQDSSPDFSIPPTILVGIPVQFEEPLVGLAGVWNDKDQYSALSKGRLTYLAAAL